jgi:hypothetical protein
MRALSTPPVVVPTPEYKTAATMGKQKSDSKTSETDAEKAAGEGSSSSPLHIQQQEEQEDAESSHPMEEEKKEEVVSDKKISSSWRWKNRNYIKNKFDSGSEDDAFAALCDAPSSARTTSDEKESSVRTSSNTISPVCDVLPDHESDWHLHIQNHKWDELENLLRDYDYKLYMKKPPKPKKKASRQLRMTKYLPEIPEMPWNSREKEVPISPLLGLDPLGRTPLHVGLSQNLPNRLLLRLLFIARDAASVADSSGSMPLHVACAHERSVEVVDRLIRGYPQASWQPDRRGRTPLMWAVEMARLKQLDSNLLVRNNTYWGFPSRSEEQEWQMAQEKIWETVHFLLENRESRRKKLVPLEHRLVLQSFGTAAPPKVVTLFMSTGEAMLAKEQVAGPLLSLCISRQYPLPIIKEVLAKIPTGFAKLYKDGTGRGIVAFHYRLGCTAHDDNNTRGKRSSFRMIMQHCANAKLELSEPYDPPAHYLEWFDKLKLFINLWGSHFDEEDQDTMDELLLHNALSNPDVPPSLVQLLAVVFPNATDLEHPKSKALPIHLACRVWRYRTFPPRRGEKEMPLDKVVSQLLEGDPKRTRKRYKDRLPLHHAIAADKSWAFLKPLVTSNRKTLRIRDPTTKLYPFQLAAGRIEMHWDREAVTSIQFTSSQWKAMRDYEKDHEIRKVEQAFALEQLTAIFELLRHDPDVIDTKILFRVEEERKAKSPVKRPLSVETFAATEDVANVMQFKAIRTSYEIGNVSAHFITWSYDKKRIGWKTHRSNLSTIKEAIMDGFVPILLDKWWRKLKIWIWHDCTWDSIPRRDEFLLHAALSNPDAPVWVVNLILECFPRSASIPIPRSGGKFPLHIACETDKYVHLPFEFKHTKTVIELTLHAYPDAILMKWDNQLPIHLAINAAKEWSDMKALAAEEPVTLAIPDPKFDFFPFQQMALHRPYNKRERSRFEKMAINQVGRSDWKKCSSHEKVGHLSKVLEDHERGVLTSIWQLLKGDAMLISLCIPDDPTVNYSYDSEDECYHQSLSDGNGPSNPQWLKNIESNLSVASLDFLGEVYEADKLESSSSFDYVDIATKSNGGTAFSDASSLGQSFDAGSLGSLGPQELVELRSEARALDEKDAGDDSPRVRTARTGSNQRWQEPDNELVIEKFDATDSEHEYEENIVDGEFEYEYEEEDPNFASDEEEGSMRDSIRNISTPNVVDKSDEKTCMNIDRLSTIIEEARSKGRPESTLPSRALKQSSIANNVLVVTDSEAFVVWKRDVFSPSSFQNLSRTEPWIAELRGMGEGVDEKELHLLRHKKEQKSVASTIVEGKAIVVDEDENFIWVLCGKRAASHVENYDIESAIAATEALADSKTDLWLDAFKETDAGNDLSASRLRHTDQDEVLDWLWSILTNRGAHQSASKTKEFDLTRTKLRYALSRRCLKDISEEANDVFFDYSRRKLSFELSKNKLICRLRSRARVRVQYKTARAHRFHVARDNLYQAFRKIDFFKKLYKKQRKAIRHAKKKSSKRKSGPERAQVLTNLRVDPMRKAVKASVEKKESNPSYSPPHLMNANQPSEVDGDSLGSTELFDPPTDMRLNQPSAVDDGDQSIGSTELFDPPVPPLPKNPLPPLPKNPLLKETQEKSKNESSLPTQPRITKQSISHPDAYEASMMLNDVFNPPSNKTQQKNKKPPVSSSKARKTHPQQAASSPASTSLSASKKRTEAVSSVQPLNKNASSVGARVVPSSKQPRPSAYESSMSFDDVFKPATLRAGNVYPHHGAQPSSAAGQQNAKKKPQGVASSKQQKKNPISYDTSMSIDDVFKPVSLRVGHVHKHNGARSPWGGAPPASQDAAKKRSTGITSSEQRRSTSARDASMTPASSSRVATNSSKVVAEAKSRSSAHTTISSTTRTSQTSSGRVKAETPRGDCKEQSLNNCSEGSLEFDDVFQ